MNKPLPKKLRAKYLKGEVKPPNPLPSQTVEAASVEPQVAVAEVVTPVPAEKAAFLLYEMRFDGKSRWHTMYDAAICLASESDYGLSGQVKDAPDAKPRPMTAEEKQKIYDLLTSLHPH
ncbi:hypothetical protein HZC53_04240 [Candidatus Uhrbacteria bacterium]|nr:hypothetical protein [Candidatus Uhrbacteria bacterium]